MKFIDAVLEVMEDNHATHCRVIAERLTENECWKMDGKPHGEPHGEMPWGRVINAIVEELKQGKCSRIKWVCDGIYLKKPPKKVLGK